VNIVAGSLYLEAIDGSNRGVVGSSANALEVDLAPSGTLGARAGKASISSRRAATCPST